MIEETNKPNAVKDSPFCRHRTVAGRRCRLRALNLQSRLCFRHSQLRQQKLSAADLSADLLGQLTEFTSAGDINTFLSKLLLLQAHDRIPPRRAAVMAYTCNLLLRSLYAMQKEAQAQDSEEPEIIFDLPRPNRD
jgi:hypothetical protein